MTLQFTYKWLIMREIEWPLENDANMSLIYLYDITPGEASSREVLIWIHA